MNRRRFLQRSSLSAAAMKLGSPALFALPSVQADPGVKRALVMFKCHLDAGFIDTQANLVHKYFDQYFPQAIELARTQNAAGKRRYVWTTGSWLIFEYPGQAAPADQGVSAPQVRSASSSA